MQAAGALAQGRNPAAGEYGISLVVCLTTEHFVEKFDESVEPVE